MMERMGFDIVWRGWIAKCLKSNTVSVLVNRSATREFSMTRGLQQGDPLSPFLFLMMAEALNGLTSVVVAKGYFRGVKIGDGELEVSHLQFADDTLFMGEATEDNIWTTKCIMRAFELVSGLKINYRKSSLIGVNTDEDWIRSMAWMLNCKIESLPCKYLGMPLGANPKRISTWKSLIDTFRRKLSVIHELDKIRRNFLWGGVEGGRKIAWVSWDRVCNTKKEGGLGVRNLRWFNIALLGKWWASLIGGEKGLWARVLLEKYGSKEGNWLSWLSGDRVLGSSWWNDICKLNMGLDSKDGLLLLNFNMNLGEGKNVRFWLDTWVGGFSQANVFPRLFLLATEKNCNIHQMGHWNNGCWDWKFQWRRPLRAWEEENLQQLLETIKHKKLVQGATDTWCWSLETGGGYTTRTAYEQLAKKEENKLLEYTKIWETQVPPKVSAFPWQLLLDRIPTKILTMHDRWEAYKGESTEDCDLMFTVKKCAMVQMKTKLQVFMAKNTKEYACDYRVEGSFFQDSCAVYVGETNTIVAQMHKKLSFENLLGKERFAVTMYPNVDHAFIAALIVILDSINRPGWI
ncbi:hypothetical protein SLEP1_g13109 [Rubroshorea leprosula]|uniref:Reverse transcriptase domain-containing protein n=1 Tax=Rubroshorea leprosula TaxID=152421 RepID=A0AAV5IMT4_9ROSI|nr:hypothetical protein SLEP1_g13109 [Rubroshorea leprosula]